MDRPRPIVVKMSTTSTYGRLGEYNPESDDWTEYVEQMEYFFAANDIEAKSKEEGHIT